MSRQTPRSVSVSRTNVFFLFTKSVQSCDRLVRFENRPIRRCLLCVKTSCTVLPEPLSGVSNPRVGIDHDVPALDAYKRGDLPFLCGLPRTSCGRSVAIVISFGFLRTCSRTDRILRQWRDSPLPSGDLPRNPRCQRRSRRDRLPYTRYRFWPLALAFSDIEFPPRKRCGRCLRACQTIQEKCSSFFVSVSSPLGNILLSSPPSRPAARKAFRPNTTVHRKECSQHFTLLSFLHRDQQPAIAPHSR